MILCHYIIAIVTLTVSFVGYSAETIDTIVTKSEEYLNDRGVFEYDMTLNVIRQGEKEASYSMHTIRKDDDKMVMIFLSPKRIYKQAFLKQGENQWLYFPKIKRTMKIPIRQRLVWSDFSFADILDVNIHEEYQYRLLKDNVVERKTDCYLVEFKATVKTALYDKVELYLRKQDYAPLRKDFYTKSGKLLKTLEYFNHSQEKEIKVPLVWKMKSLLNPGYQSVLKIKNVKKVSNKPDAYFTLNALRRRS